MLNNNDDDFKDIKENLKEIDKRLGSIDVTLIKQEANLDKHMMRTEQNEKLIEIIYNDMKPVKRHVAQIEGGLKFVGVASLVIGIILGLIKIFEII